METDKTTPNKTGKNAVTTAMPKQGATKTTTPKDAVTNLMPQEAQSLQQKQTNKKAAKPQTKRESLTSKSAVLHTYKQDVQGLVRSRNVSLLGAVAAESDRPAALQTKTPADQKQKRDTTLFMFIASIALLVLGAVALFVAYSAHQTRQATITADKQQVLTDNGLVFVEHRARFDTTDRLPRETLAELSKLRNASQATLGSVTDVILQKRVWDQTRNAEITYTLNAQELLGALGLSLSSDFTRYLAPDYLFGLHIADRNTPFLLFTTNSYDHAFAAMLEWEGRAEAELAPLFSVAGVPGARTIEDIVVKNIDARAVRDDSQNLHILYAFLDPQTLLITNNIHTLTEVARRYQVRKSAGNALEQ